MDLDTRRPRYLGSEAGVHAHCPRPRRATANAPVRGILRHHTKRPKRSPPPKRRGHKRGGMGEGGREKKDDEGLGPSDALVGTTNGVPYTGALKVGIVTAAYA